MGVMNDITQGSYMDMLGEYYVGRGQLQDGIINLSNPYRGNVVDDSEIRDMLDSGIWQGYFQPPSPNQLYFVYTAPNVLVTRGGLTSQDFGGYHDSFWDPYLGPIYYAVIPHPIGNFNVPGLNYFQQQTMVTSHELAEAVTDPDYQGRFQYDTSQEIGDLCEDIPVYRLYHGYIVQSEWSNYWNSCVIPYDATLYYPTNPGPSHPGGAGHLRAVGDAAPEAADTSVRDLAALTVGTLSPSAHAVPTTTGVTAPATHRDDFFAGSMGRVGDSAPSGHRRSDAEPLGSSHDLGDSLTARRDEAFINLDASLQRNDGLAI